MAVGSEVEGRESHLLACVQQRLWDRGLIVGAWDRPARAHQNVIGKKDGSLFSYAKSFDRASPQQPQGRNVRSRALWAGPV